MKISFLKEEGLWVKAQRLFYTKTNLKSRKKPNYIFFRTYKSKTAHNKEGVKITQKLFAWEKKGNEPLLEHNARQVGKTYSIREFGKEYYQDVVYVNFETTSRLARDFEEDISSSHIISCRELFLEKKIIPEETLIFFDEVQVSEGALTSLKYFCEDAPQYHIIAAGSLLKVAINREKYSFPVARLTCSLFTPWILRNFSGRVTNTGS